MRIGPTRRRSAAIAFLMCACSCSAADREIEPDELDARDLLGLSPSVASRWDEDERAAARAVLMEAWGETWAEGGAEVEVVGIDRPGATREEGVVSALTLLDRRRVEAGQAPVIAGIGAVEGSRLRLGIASPLELDLDGDRVRDRGDAGGRDASPLAAASIELVDWRPEQSELVDRGAAWLAALARLAGHPPGEPLRLRAALQAPFGAVYLGKQPGLFINPVVLAALDPAVPSEPTREPIARLGLRHGGDSSPEPIRALPARSQPSAAGGNPYSFYGSVAECAAAERLRCEACLPSACVQTSRDAPDGDAECETLASGGGAGYYLYCINLSLAIATVADCTEDEGPGCPQDTGASNRIGRLDANQVFLDDDACRGALDQCLAAIYGESDGDFPPPPPDAGPEPDGGTSSPPPPSPPSPRETNISCGEADCDFSPQCDSSCSGDCDQVFTCDADCNGSDGRSEGCEGDGGDGKGGGSGGSGGGCEGGGGDGSGGSGGGSNSCDSDCGDGDCGDGDCGNGDCGDGDCGNGDCGNGDCGGDCNSGGSGNCTVAAGHHRTARGGRACPRRAARSDPFAALAWAILPLSYLERCRRRARRRQLARSDRDVPR